MGTYTRNKLNYIRMIKMTRKKIVIIIKYTLFCFFPHHLVLLPTTYKTRNFVLTHGNNY